MKRFAAGILVKENKILLGLRRPDRAYNPGFWDFVGGHCFAGELYSSAMIRELKEELNIEVTAYKEFMIIDRTPAFIMKLFLVYAWQGTPVNNAQNEHSKIEWFTPENAKKLHFFNEEFIQVMGILHKKIQQPSADNPNG
jgi:8-oxo-dGTP diphosphatase